MILHTPTMFVVIIAVSIGLAVFTAAIAHRRFADISLWSGAMALHAVAYILFGLRGQVSDTLSIVVGNTVLAIMFAVFGEAVYRFQGSPAPRWVLWSPVLATAIGFEWLLANQQGRFVLSGALLSVQCLLIIVPLVRAQRDINGRGPVLLILGLSIVIVTLMLRAWSALHGAMATESMAVPSMVQGYSFMGVIVSMLCFSLGFVTMHQERATHISKLATTKLQQSEERYRQFIETANEGICVLDDSGVIRFVNPKLLELLAFAQDEVQGQSFLNFIHPEDRVAGAALHTKHMEDAVKSFRFPLRLVTKHHTQRWFEVGGTTFVWEGKPATLNFMTDITERRQMEERIHSLAYVDTLTSIPNRRQLMDQIRMALANNKRTGKAGAVLFMDLDNFKTLNDTHGHSVGDLLLIEAASRLKAVVRETDIVARFGGDEFVVLLGNLDANDAAASSQALDVAKKIWATLTTPYQLNAVITHASSASIGIALFSDQHDDEDALLQQADAAMYQAKQAGKNRIRFFDAA
jgi:diguanylate cyclase (GGDEF)-like protein/PAS domain S-box-containing protein